VVAAAAIVFTVGACGTHGDGSAAARPSPTPSDVGSVVRVTEQDHSVTLVTGQKLLLELHARPGMTQWSDVRSSNASVLKPVTIDVMVPTGVTVEMFQAVAQGQAVVTAAARPACSPGQGCIDLLVTYSLYVTVAPG
jgi:hypothetical protein